MKAGIVGAGAMGSLFGYFFSRAGIDFVVYEKDPVVVEALAGGLAFRDASPDAQETSLTGSDPIIVPYSACPDPSVLHNCDIILILVKSYATKAAAIDIASHLDEKTVVVSLQNGLGNNVLLGRHLPKNRLVFGATTIGGYKDSPSSVVLGGLGEIIIGGDNTSAVSSVSDILGKTGLKVITTDTPLEAVWKKAIINAAINPLGALMGCVNGEIIKNPHLVSLQEEIVREAVSVARAEGIPIDDETMLATVRDVCLKTSANRCSMLQDLDHHRKTEIDAINGYIVETGRQHGLGTPFNEAVYRMVRAREN